ncbi:MAG: hypothetical protein LBR44_08610 [Clostridiales Family XIII bacterium]|nr:hypothetical protein [Clostridiales Family XIII bacterium]
MNRLRIAGALLAGVVLLAGCASGASTQAGGSSGALTREAAAALLAERLAAAEIAISQPAINLAEAEGGCPLPGIDTYPLSVEGAGEIDVEIFSSTEKAGTGNNGWLNDMAEQFNAKGLVVDGKTVSVSVRPVTSGLATDYIKTGAYVPDAFTPSNRLWAEIIREEAPGAGIEEVCGRLCGNTAGIIMDPESYNQFMDQYGEVTAETIVEAVTAGDLAFGYTSPHVSSTGLNLLTQLLLAIDPEDPVSDKAREGFAAFEANIPSVTSTTEQMVTNMTGGVTAAAMECQAYADVDSMQDFVFTPMGVRHDNPLYVFSGTGEAERAALELFKEHCLTDEAQAQATACGFNANLAFTEQDPGLDGAQLVAAQALWDEADAHTGKVCAVFVADAGGAGGDAAAALKDTISRAQRFIPENSYAGLVTVTDGVGIEVPAGLFAGAAPLQFSMGTQALAPGGAEESSDALIAALAEIEALRAEDPGVKPMVFFLTAGETAVDAAGIARIAEGLGIPVYTAVAGGDDADLSAAGELAVLSGGERFEWDEAWHRIREVMNDA